MAWQACYALITTALITESTRPRHTPSLGFKHNIVRRPLRPLTATTLTTAPSSKTEILVDDASFKRPAVDSRQYRLLKLANGLEVALVSDRDADEAGAALSVKAGSFDDTLLGLAHFHSQAHVRAVVIRAVPLF